MVLPFVTSIALVGAQAPSTPQDYPAAGKPAIVTLVAPGAQPRTALRYAIAKDYKAHMDLTMLMNMSMAMAGGPEQPLQMPGIKMGADVQVTNVAPSGDVSFDLAFTGVHVDEAGADPSIVAMLQSLDTDFKGVRGSTTMTNRGAASDWQIDLSKVTNPQLSQMMGSLSSSLNNLSVPLPEDAVGVGARWEARQTIQANGVQVRQKTTFELVALDGRAIKFKMTIEQTAPPQAINNPSMPPGADAALEQWTGNGGGTVAIDLTSLVPTSETTMQSSMVMSISFGGATQQVTVGLTAKFGIAPGKS